MNSILQQWVRKTFAAMAVVAGFLVMPPAQAAGDVAETQAAASTRAYWNAFVAKQQKPGFGSKALTPPVIKSIAISNPNLDTTVWVRPVTMNLYFSSTAGLSTVMIDFRSRDYHQGYRREFVVPYPQKSGPLVFQSPLFYNRNQPGSWDIRYIGICDVNGMCTSQDFYGLDPVASRSFTLTNNRPPDLDLPVVQAATLNTTALTTSSDGMPRNVLLSFQPADPGSTATGVVGISVCARPPDESTERCGYWEMPAAISAGRQQFVTIPFVGNQYVPGTWHIAVVELVDRAGNNLFVNDPGMLDAMFPNGRTFTLTNGS